MSTGRRGKLAFIITHAHKILDRCKKSQSTCRDNIKSLWTYWWLQKIQICTKTNAHNFITNTHQLQIYTDETETVNLAQTVNHVTSATARNPPALF